ncbi:MAG: undecaprenyl/decaprenyl-phosphate alpha-N-acetylglucosaminyl 1-phosphate transferase [Sedimentisphaerales bacterium]|nr:undecaprenyl/decaprenyl-phosphate alpha-N-acetylglucosaminyl 1-phosphate transferase [Sedimentisphaerales bacterium]
MALGVAVFVLAIVATLLVRRWALRVGFVDRPGERKIHVYPISLGGGIVIYWLTIFPLAIAGILGLLFYHYGTPGWVPQVLSAHVPGLASRRAMLACLVVAATMLHLMGLRDDRRALGPGVKLLVQLAAALLVTAAGGIRFSFFIPNPVITTILSVLWIMVITNAFNFLDNMDGLSAGVAAICSVIILSAAISSGQVFVSGLLCLLIGSLAGFLIFNFHPAKIFMGDSGSLVVGFLVAVATMQTTYYQHTGGGTWYATLMPLIVLAVPLYDFLSVMVIRLSQGRSPFVGDKQHFSHRLTNRGMTQRQAVGTIYLATACTGLGATILHQVRASGVVLVFVQTMLIVLIIAILERPEKK